MTNAKAKALAYLRSKTNTGILNDVAVQNDGRVDWKNHCKVRAVREFSTSQKRDMGHPTWEGFIPPFRKNANGWGTRTFVVA
jgi:hypothetical protein